MLTTLSTHSSGAAPGCPWMETWRCRLQSVNTALTHETVQMITRPSYKVMLTTICVSLFGQQFQKSKSQSTYSMSSSNCACRSSSASMKALQWLTMTPLVVAELQVLMTLTALSSSFLQTIAQKCEDSDHFNFKILTLQGRDAFSVLFRHFWSCVFESIEAFLTNSSIRCGHLIFLILECVNSEHGIIKTLAPSLLVSQLDIITLQRN